jgi:hypothetical protein
LGLPDPDLSLPAFNDGAGAVFFILGSFIFLFTFIFYFARIASEIVDANGFRGKLKLGSHKWRDGAVNSLGESDIQKGEQK